MKKFLLTLLLMASCACTVAAVSCKDDNGESSSSEASSEFISSESSSESAEVTRYTVTLTQGEGFTYTSETVSGSAVAEGATVSFSLNVNGLYTGTPAVFANNKALSSSGGVYSFVVTENTTVTVNGIQKDVSNMVGSGTMDDAFVISKPIDFVYIAEQVNAGVQKYVTGSYIIANDIDCKGAELKVIGDGSTENAYFSGVVSCMNDQDTGEIARYTISNFVINSDSSNYVGLFGNVIADLATTSSGLFYGVCLDNFTINASITNPVDRSNLSVFCGSLIGYGIGAKTYLCEATNGSIHLYADKDYFSYAGGLIGIQQSYYAQEFLTSFASEAAYCKTDVDITGVSGMVYAAGGISGGLMTNAPLAVAYIHNSYALGTVSGAMRTGGIVGLLGQYSSVTACYSAGNVHASSSQTLVPEYYNAYAGGVVGYAENDSIVSDSFSLGTISAHSEKGETYAITSSTVGGGDDAATVNAVAEKYIVYNCPQTVDLAQITQIETSLGWKSYNWKLQNGVLPELNLESSGETVFTTLTVNYATKDGTAIPVGDSGATSTSAQFEDSYQPFIDLLSGGALPVYEEAQNGYLSYGYYFADGNKVPYSFVATKDVTLTMKFADPTPILDKTYYFVADGQTGSISFDETGYAHYTSGAKSFSTPYSFDGETLIIEAAALATYADLKFVEDASGNLLPDVNQSSVYDFKGVLNADGTLSLFDGTYFTEIAPLLANFNDLNGSYYTGSGNDACYYTFRNDYTGAIESLTLETTFTYTVNDGVISIQPAKGDAFNVNRSDLIAYDAFAGDWVRSATVMKTYRFDGVNAWEYYEFNDSTPKAFGTYTLEQDGTITLDDVAGTKVSFNEAGELVVSGETFYRSGSVNGTWLNYIQGGASTSNCAMLLLHGINKDGIGNAQISYAGNETYDLTYEAFQKGYYSLFYSDTIFGYFYYEAYSNMLVACVYDPYLADYAQTNFYVLDDYEGEWISNDLLFETVTFNGVGMYSQTQGADQRLEAKLVIDGETVEYTLNSVTLKGSFDYKGNRYEIAYDDNAETVTISLAGEPVTTMSRKDILSGIDFVDTNGNSFSFDGKSSLLVGGKLTVVINGQTSEYSYYPSTNGYSVGNAGDELTRVEDHYELTLNGNTYSLYVKNDWMGEWAMSGEYDKLVIGPTDLDGKVLATFKRSSVKMEYVTSSILSFTHTDAKLPVTYYVHIVDEECIILSQYASLYYGGYTICSKPNEWYGSWVKGSGLSADTFVFDGVSNNYTNGQVKRIFLGTNAGEYYYTMMPLGLLIWSQMPVNNVTTYYTFVECEASDRDAYKNGDKAYKLVEVDSLFGLVASDENDVTYTFDGQGTVTASNGAIYTYADGELTYNTDKTVTILLTNTQTQAQYDAVLDYSDAANPTIRLTPVVLDV